MDRTTPLHGLEIFAKVRTMNEPKPATQQVTTPITAQATTPDHVVTD
jgi:hypothetical protein